ncbi:MAG TPA: hypothetical protein VG937_39645 [Polyangiaceae bacterium]|nr:hypothetical protein [Polyangiaceae bacterium]
MNPFDKLLRRSVPSLLRLACVLALLALGILCVSVLVPRPIPVIFAMSAGHAVGGAAFALYVLAVILDAVLKSSPRSSVPPSDARK